MSTHCLLCRIYHVLILICLVFLLFGCASDHNPTEIGLQATEKSPVIVFTSMLPSSTKEIRNKTKTPAPTPQGDEQDSFLLYISPILPEKFISSIELPPNIEIVSENVPVDLLITILRNKENHPNVILSNQVFALAAPFPTILDEVGSVDIFNFWQGLDDFPDGFKRILLSETTMQLLSQVWGEPASNVVEILPEDDLLEASWKEANRNLVIVPLDTLDPRWKVIRIDGISPLDSTYDPDQYLLQVMIGLESPLDFPINKLQKIGESIRMPATNRDASKITSLIMTGTTALVRYTALKMEENGVLYPAADIASLLKDADFTHISNEVPFFPDCPPAVPVRVEQRFCSDPSYFELLEYIDVDLVELTGNHILDWGYEPLLYTLKLYENHNIPYFGGGRNLEEAQHPLILDNHGEELLFVGCSPAGPQGVWATEDLPGSNPCNWDLITEQIRNALEKKMIPIITFQHIEVEDYVPHSSQRVDFLRAANAGAVIVSGSQSHFAQSITFVGDHFVHYGLGNLFFDQMYGENPHEFVDKHYFYNGRYISTELITLTLEDSAKPRLMTTNERAAFLQTIFDHSDWKTVFQEGGE